MLSFCKPRHLSLASLGLVLFNFLDVTAVDFLLRALAATWLQDFVEYALFACVFGLQGLRFPGPQLPSLCLPASQDLPPGARLSKPRKQRQRCLSTQAH